MLLAISVQTGPAVLFSLGELEAEITVVGPHSLTGLDRLVEVDGAFILLGVLLARNGDGAVLQLYGGSIWVGKLNSHEDCVLGLSPEYIRRECHVDNMVLLLETIDNSRF